MDNELFNVNTQQQLIYSILTEPNNLNYLKEALKWQGVDYDLKINKIVSLEEKIESDLHILKEFDCKIDIIDE